MNGKIWRKILSVYLVLLMVAALVPTQLFSVSAASNVTYLNRYWDGSKVVTENKTADCQDYHSGITNLDGWYYVN